MEAAKIQRKTLQIRLGKKLRQLREAHGFSQQRLAKLAGMVQPMINRFETGERKISVDHAKELARVFRIDPTVLLPLGDDVPAQQVATDTAQNIAVLNMPLHDLIEDRARRDGDYAIAFALLKLADVLGQVANRSADSER